MNYKDLSPEEYKRLNELLSRTTMRSVGFEQPPKAAPAAPPAPQNFIRNNRTGAMTSLDYAAPGGSGVDPASGRRVAPDVWADGPQTLQRLMQSDGTTLVAKKVPAMDGFGRQSSSVQYSRETPDYLNPLKRKELDYRKKVADVARAEQEKSPTGRGTWSRPFESNGKLFQFHSGTGELRPVMADGQQLDGAGAAKVQKAKLAAENTRNYANTAADTLESQIADIFGTDRANLAQMLSTDNTSQAARKIAPAVGIWDQRLPTLFQKTKDIESAITALKNSAQRFGLTELRKAGVAPGTITEKEWAKFETALANIDPSLGEEAFVKQMRDMYANIRRAREAGSLGYDEIMGQAAPQALAPEATGNLTEEDAQALMWAAQNPQDPRAAAIRAMFGAQ